MLTLIFAVASVESWTEIALQVLVVLMIGILLLFPFAFLQVSTCGRKGVPLGHKTRSPKLRDEGISGLLALSIGLIGYAVGLFLSPVASPAMAGITGAFALTLAKAAMLSLMEKERGLTILEVGHQSEELLNAPKPPCYFA